jgi:hypothetical protein
MTITVIHGSLEHQVIKSIQEVKCGVHIMLHVQ